MHKIRVLTTLDKLDELHRLAERKKAVSINAQDLTNLLIDHSVLARELTSHGVIITDTPSRNKPSFDA